MSGTKDKDRELKDRFQKIISERIRQQCCEKEISYYTLAFRSSLAMSTIMNIVDGASLNPGVYNIMKICDGLEMTLSEFFNTKEFEDFIIESRDEN